jgi:hypothetical protein
MAEALLSLAAMQNDPSDATGSDSAGLPEMRPIDGSRTSRSDPGS